jgi:tetratricopeptide (TPR) repeat protein
MIDGMMKRFCVFIFPLFCIIASSAQGLKITEVKETVSGSDAFHAPMDKNGHPCGLVKIQAMIPDLRFEGEVEGDFMYENNEYKVFLAKGSKQLMIKRPQVLPVVVNFPDFGIGEISSKATYNIKLKEVSLNATKNLLVIDVMPRKANVYIDDLLIDNENGDGGYRLLLPKGEHLCKIECRGYRSYASVVKIGKGTQTINAGLESLLADVEIVSQTSGARIIVDGKEVGVGSWKGKLPADSYKIDVQLEGYISSSQTLVLDEKDNRTVSIPQLKRAKGSLSVITNVKEAKVYLDGKLVSNPQNIEDIQTGEHKLLVKVPFGYKDVERNVTVHTGSNTPIQIKMEPLNDIYAKAFNGDINAQVQICSQKIESAKYTNSNDSLERNYWFEKIYTNLDRLNKEQFRKVCPIITDQSGFTDLSWAGMYTYFCCNTEKRLNVLKKWNDVDPGDRSVVNEIVSIYLNENNDEEVALWAEEALESWAYDGEDVYYMKLIAKVYIKKGDIKRVFPIYKIHAQDQNMLMRGYIAVGDAYKEIGDKMTAITYYERFLKEATNADKYEKEDVLKSIQECRR